MKNQLFLSEPLENIVQDNRTQFKNLIVNGKTVSSQNKRNRINCSFTDKEYKKILSLATATGFNLSASLKKCAIAYIDNAYVVPLSLEERLSDLIFLTSNITNNINQIAKYANTSKSITADNFFIIKKAVHDLEEKIENFINKPNPKQ